jgi:hypothetical protein
VDTLITPAQKRTVIAVAVICFVVMLLVKLRLDYIIGR